MNKIKINITNIKSKFTLLLALTTLLTGTLSLTGRAFATTYMTHASVIEYNMNTSATSSVAVVFTAGAADGAGNLTVGFAGWTGGAAGIVNTTQAVGTTGCIAMTGAANTLPGAITASGTGSTVTVGSVGALTSGQSYCFVLTSSSAVTNPTASGQTVVTITDGTDTASTAIYNLANDQITVSAVVPPSFTLGLSGNTDSFVSNLSSSSTVVTTGVTATINTNATSGWGLWAEDSQAGIRSATQSHTVATVATGSLHTFTTGTEQYGIAASVNPTTNYAYGGGTTGGGLSTSAYNEIASNNAPASGVTTVVRELADVSGSTQAAQDYSDVVTLVGAGSF